MSRGTFYGLEISKTGLFASQRGLELTGHNMANATTEGYTRQRLNLVNIDGATVQGIVLQYTNGQVGGGVRIQNIQQIRNEFLDSQYRNEMSQYKAWETKADTMYYVEDVVNEPSDSGLSGVLLDMYGSLQELSKKPQNEDIRNLVRQNAITLTETMNYYAEKLEKIQRDRDEALTISAKEANNLLREIADLNLSIVKYELSGENANDLMDKRNLKLDKLSEIVDITYKYDERNRVSVYLGSGTDNVLLDMDTSSLTIENGMVKDMEPAFVVSEGDQSHYGNYTLHNISVGGMTLTGDTSSGLGNIKGGTMKGDLDMIYGDSALTYGLDYIMTQFDTFTEGIVQIFNKINQQGYSIPNDENGNKSTNGLDFFDPASTTAMNMKISDALQESVWNIAASDKEIDLSAENTQEGNNMNALEFASIQNTNFADQGIAIGRIDDFLAGIVSEVGVQAKYINDMADTQKIISNSVTEQRASVSNVSIDEEVTNMMTYMKSFQASSRMITTIDQMLDKLINGTGVVGL